MRHIRPLAAITLLGAFAAPAAAQSPATSPSATWTTLGTNSGPIPSPVRFEPANLLRLGSLAVLVDSGDGAADQLARAGVSLASLHYVVLSHLHFDHTGGLFAVISLRYQMLAPGILTVYGPPGTKATVDGLLAAMAPSPAAGPHLARGPAETVRVIEVVDGSTFAIGDVKIIAAANTHYAATPGGDRYVSLSYRFDMPGRSIGFTGDTGPSAAVERLERGVDLLVSEVIDPAQALADLKTSRPGIPAEILAVVRRHFEQEHLSPEQAGLLAERAGAKALVLTHDVVDPANTQTLLPGITRNYKGPVSFARDLDRF